MDLANPLKESTFGRGLTSGGLDDPATRKQREKNKDAADFFSSYHVEPVRL